MIATRSARPATTARSWVISIRPMPSSSTSRRKQREDRRLGGDVERGRRLVGDQQLRAQRDRHGDADALALAAGELVRVAGQREARRGQPDALERRGGDRPRLGPAGGAVDADGLGHLVADRLQRVERGHRLLEDHADVAAANRADARARRAAADRDRRAAMRPAATAPCGSRPHHREGGHRLARAALADDAEHLAAARRSSATRSRIWRPWMASDRSSMARSSGAVTRAPGGGAGRAGRAGRRPSG